MKKDTSIIGISNKRVYNMYESILGARNPMNSWDKSDSKEVFVQDVPVIGPADMKLLQNLIIAGPEHRKFMRQITVSFDINLPRYAWSELDTYKHMEKNSTSTMHRLIHPKVEITTDNFYYDKEDIVQSNFILNTVWLLNDLKKKYLNTESPKEKQKILITAKTILPESYLQMRSVTTNYEQLRNIYFQRRNHRLPIWQIVCEQIQNFPYAQHILLFTKEDKGGQEKFQSGLENNK
jgi:hypothetical protein